MAMRLQETYAASPIHDRWREVYRTDPGQIAFDEEVYDWLFRRLFKSNDRGVWLDAGCGTGLHAIQLANRGASVVAVDVSSSAIETAKSAVESLDIGSRVSFQTASLEEPLKLRADHVHCRGVLMHIPEWESALKNLCESTAPGGFLVLFETHSRSFEALIVRAARWFKPRKSTLKSTPAGLEFWSEFEGKPFLVRMANLKALERVMRAKGVTPLLRQSLGLFDFNRFPKAARRPVLFLNKLWFRFNLPFPVSVILVGKKEH
jgi:SAM-dependent methyltransferase